MLEKEMQGIYADRKRIICLNIVQSPLFLILSNVQNPLKPEKS